MNNEHEFIEHALLSLCCRFPDIFNAVDKHVDKYIFSSSVNFDIFRAIRSYHFEKNEFDIVSMISHVMNTANISSEFAENILSAPASEHSFEVYLDTLKNASAVRRLLNFHGECADILVDASKKNPITLAERMQEKLQAISSSGVRNNDGDLLSACKEITDNLDNPEHKYYWPTGYSKLDEIIGGLRPGSILTLAADTGGGKTTLAMNIATKQVMQYQKKVLVVSMEMKRTSLATRLISSLSGVPFWKIEASRCDDAETNKITAVATKLGSLASEFIILQDPFMTPDIIASELRFQSFRRPVDVLVIDYLQLLEFDEKYDSYEKITKASRSIKQLAMKFNIPIILISQFNRSKNARAQDDRKPMLSDLKGSGNIETDSDVICFLVNDEEGNKEKMAEITVKKNRYGPKDKSFFLPFIGEIFTFKNII